jgi:hypothetical protein
MRFQPVNRKNGLKYNKLIAFDDATFEQIRAAAACLGIPDTAFIRLAVHRALEQILSIYEEMVDGLAYEYVESRAKRHARGGSLTRLRRHLCNISVSEQEAAREVDLASRKRTPRFWGELEFPGPPLDQNYARKLIGNDLDSRTARKVIRNRMVEFFQQRVLEHVGDWLNLQAIQETVVEILFGNPSKLSELENSNTQHLSHLGTILKALYSPHKPPKASMKSLEELSPLVYRDWKEATTEIKRALIQERMRKISTNQKHLEQVRARKRQELLEFQRNPLIWLNPSKLQKMLNDWRIKQGKL